MKGAWADATTMPLVSKTVAVINPASHCVPVLAATFVLSPRQLRKKSKKPLTW